MDRVLISGISGSGKTTLAVAVSVLLGLPRFELDALHHGPGWVKREDFESDVDTFSAGSRWVTEDQYHTALGDLLWQRADTVVWLDLPRRTVMQRVIRRSVVRAVTRRELWNGNRESIRDWLDPGHPIRWAWSQYESRRPEITGRTARHPQLTVIRLHSGRDARRWLNEVRAGSPPGSRLTSPPSSLLVLQRYGERPLLQQPLSLQRQQNGNALDFSLISPSTSAASASSMASASGNHRTCWLSPGGGEGSTSSLSSRYRKSR